MKIAGVYPVLVKEQPQRIISFNEPIGLEYTLALAQKRGHEVKIFRPESVKEWREIAKYSPDLVCFSLMACQYNLGKKINLLLKKSNPRIISITGGYHSSAEPAIACEGFDFVVIGEGEATFADLLTAIEQKKRDLKWIKGLAFMEKRNLVITGTRERIINLDELPDPYREPGILRAQAGMICLNYPPTSERRIAYLEYSRGCPFLCKFCCSPRLFGGIMAFRSPRKIIRQIKYLKSEYRINYVFFVDLNITVNRKKLVELCDALIKENLGVNWTCMGSFRGVDRALLKKMRESGCTKIGWGIETVQADEKIETKTRKLPGLDRVARILDYSADLGILNEGFLMIGFPWETMKHLGKTAELLLKYNIHIIRPAIYTPFPGAVDYDTMRREGKIKEKNLDKYDCRHLVYGQALISEKKLIAFQDNLIKKFYRSVQYKNRVAKFIKQHPEYRKSFDEFLPTVIR